MFRLAAKFAIAAALLPALLLPTPLRAQIFESERDKPMDIDADHFDGLMSENSVSRLIGNVLIRQGDMEVRADLAIVTTRDGEIAKVELEGKPVRMKMLDSNGEPTTGRANRVEYRLDDEIVIFTGAVLVEQPRGNVRGERIVYRLDTGRIDGGGDGGRIQLRIQPKSGENGAGSR